MTITLSDNGLRLCKGEPFDAGDERFRAAFEAVLDAGNWPNHWLGHGYRSPMTNMAWRVAFETVNRLGLFERPVPAEPVNARLLDALHSTIDLLWLEGSCSVEFDGTVMFGPSYDFSGLDRRIEFLWPGFNCIVWPGSGWDGKWSAYCTYEGSLWFEKFETKEQAKDQCLRLLDQVMPNHPVSKARDAIAAAEAQQAEPVRLTDDDLIALWDSYVRVVYEGHSSGFAAKKVIAATEAAVLRKNGHKVEG